MHIFKCMYAHALTHVSMHAYTKTDVHTHIHMHTRVTKSHTVTQRDMHIHRHTCQHTHTHTWTHIPFHCWNSTIRTVTGNIVWLTLWLILLVLDDFEKFERILWMTNRHLKNVKSPSQVDTPPYIVSCWSHKCYTASHSQPPAPALDISEGWKGCRLPWRRCSWDRVLTEMIWD